MSAWTPESWQAKTVAQSVRYPDPAALARVLTEMRQLPPLVTSWEVEGLRTQLAAAARSGAILRGRSRTRAQTGHGHGHGHGHGAG